MESDFELHRQRRGLFTGAAAAYRLGRPGYPDAVFSLLRDRGLGADSSVLEIGPGTGQATSTLLDDGAKVTAVELGAELAAELQLALPGRDPCGGRSSATPRARTRFMRRFSRCSRRMHQSC